MNRTLLISEARWILPSTTCNEASLDGSTLPLILILRSFITSLHMNAKFIFMNNVIAIERTNLKISLVGCLASSQMSQKALDMHEMLRDVGASNSIWGVSFLSFLH